MGLLLDIGCGESKKDGAIGLDFRRTAHVDIIAAAEQLPFRKESFDHVYSSHLLEHFSHHTTKSVLVEWLRVLKQAGKIEIRCPDLRARAMIFALSPKWKYVSNIYGAQDYVGNYHKSGFSYGLLKELLMECGITDVRRLIKGYKGIPFLPDCLHVTGINGVRDPTQERETIEGR